MSTPIDIELLTYATEAQAVAIRAVHEHGSARAAAAHIGISHQAITAAIARVRANAAQRGYAPEHDMRRPAAPGFAVKGTSTYYDEDGKVRGQWVKTTQDKAEMAELLKEFALGLAEEVKGLAPLTKPPAATDDDLLSVYPMGDPHVGMMAWWEETGNNFNLKIAERLTCAAVDRLVSSAPASRRALLLNLGDMFHADNQSNVTRSGHQLDVDGRWKKVLQVGLRAMVHCIRRLLEKHAEVLVRINSGNHDGHTSYALALMLDCYFHGEPRVIIDLSPAATWYLHFGNNLIGSTHGDTIKGKDMMGVMAADKAAEWGQTRHRYWYVGHVHHQDVKEYPGGVVEYFRTLAARDAWHAGQGYRAGRDMRLIVLHREHGEIERHRCDIAMLDETPAPDQEA